ncbi:hypothetical protein [Altericroceibacterium xinjiangense]|uniref:hypothetical protein n=1 Tax=Altericroceibacterium xinjiangense TaxID=762261 RepID=UPI000F7ED854|nr:hypothetical protein [Altericroceibacterium xinjiangense]
MNPTLTIVTAAMAVIFALIHLFIRKLRFLEGIPRTRWLSFAAGVAVAYIFLDVMPELASHRETFAEQLGLAAGMAEVLIYALALAGLVGFYGLERLAKTSRARANHKGQSDKVEQELLWIHVGSFGAYNVLIGYLLLHREEAGWWSLLVYFFAIALHFVTTDFGLLQDYKEAYNRLARWVLAAAVTAGWLIGKLVTLPEVVIGFLFGFLAGGIVLNVLKEELPQERKSRYGPFVMGAGVFTALTLAIQVLA